MSTKSVSRLLSAASTISLVCAISAIGPVSPAFAQAQASAGTGGELEEIVVTAQRREEKLQTVPLTAEAFTPQRLVERHVDTMTDLANLVPALSTSQSVRNDENFTLRGQTGYGASFSGQQVAVPIYFNEVPLPIGDGAGPGRFFDLQNVQVLEGPQGTLFGRNSTGGAVLFTPKGPSNQYEGYAEFQYGSYNDVGVEGAVNVPVIPDKLEIRAAVKYEKRDGFTYDPTTTQWLDDRNYVSGRVSILALPTDTLENLTVIDIYHMNSNGTSTIFTNYDPLSSPGKFLGPTLKAALLAQEAAGPRVTFGDVLGRDDIDSIGVSNTTTWNILSNLALKNIFAYRHFEQLENSDHDGSPATLADFDTCLTVATCNTATPSDPELVNVEQYTEELQLQGTVLDDKLNYTVGFFYLYDDSPGSNYEHETALLGTQVDFNTFYHDQSYAGYVQGSYDLSPLVDGLKVIAGLRNTQDDRFLLENQTTAFKCATGITGALAPSPGNAPQCNGYFKTSENETTYTWGFEYQITPEAMVYFTNRRGYREGGVNPGAGQILLANPPLPFAQAFFTYKPEYVVDFEAGAKADWHYDDMSLRTNLSLYHSSLHNAQIYQTLSVNGLSPYGLTNATNAKIDGIELETLFVPIKPVEIRGSYAYTQASFGPYLNYLALTPALQPTFSPARPFPFVPKHKFNLDARYQLPIDASYGDLGFDLSWTHKTSQLMGIVPYYHSGAFDPFSVQGPTDDFDLTVNWTDILQSGIDATFYVTNLTNTVYAIGGATLVNSSGYDQAVMNEPRMMGIQIRKKFGN